MFQIRQTTVLLTFLIIVKSTIISDEQQQQAQQQASMLDDFKQCLISKPTPPTTINSFTTLGYCFSVGAINKLQKIDNEPEFDLIDGVRFSRNQQEFREIYNFAERDPSDFRSIVDSFNYVFARRNLHWDMDFIYPGLGMRITPSTSPGGVLEFVLDPHRENLNKHSFKEITTGRLLARQLMLPFLLGFKFNVATIIPILFGILALLAKKALFFSKIALIISSAYALGSLLLGNNYVSSSHQHYQQYPSNPAYTQFNKYPENEHQPEIFYRGLSEPNPDNYVDQLHLHGNIGGSYSRADKGNGRNFAWSEDEKLEKNPDS